MTRYPVVRGQRGERTPCVPGTRYPWCCPMPWLTYTEIADRFAISRDAAKMLAKRRKWQKASPNQPGGTIRLLVPDTDNGEERSLAPDNGENAPPAFREHVTQNQPPVSPFVSPFVTPGAEARPGAPGASDSIPASAHNQVVATYEAALNRQERQLDQLRADMATQQRRADAEIERLVGQFHAERSFWTERADAAECRAEASAAALNDLAARILALVPAPSPAGAWWARWLGSSKRSEL